MEPAETPMTTRPLDGGDDQVSTIRRVQEIHGHIRRLAPSPTAVTVCEENYPLVRDVTGYVPLCDGLFLLSLIEQAAPRHILELGVASGTATLMILKYLAATDSTATLTSVDVLEHYFDDPSRALGFLVSENLRPLPSQWRLLAPFAASDFVDAPALQGQEQARRYDFVLIDAHHGHPWPTLDALCLLPFAAPRSWVALHDVSLAILDEKYNTRGPQFLMQQWPGETCISDELIPNIGAIRLSDAGKNDAAHLVDVLERRWDCRPHPFWEDKIMKHLRSILDSGQLARVASAFEKHAHLGLL